MDITYLLAELSAEVAVVGGIIIVAPSGAELHSDIHTRNNRKNSHME